MMKPLVFTCLTLICSLISAQDTLNVSGIHNLDFLIGTWEVREDNEEKTWWEESTRKGSYIMDSTYIELRASAVSSSGKKRTYIWLIHYNAKAQQFEMVSMFSNWHKIQFDILIWDKPNRTLTVKSGGDLGSYEFHERFGEIVFNENLNEYIWKGENKYGEKANPSIWRYTEIGSKVEDSE
ncbi:hypothetical protein [Ekhidna sp. To15]|uniref:hypothetical protein n=1 Tax=Ekhidna sp. To15 TaxID=3395267 RepID=UPI003F523B08